MQKNDTGSCHFLDAGSLQATWHVVFSARDSQVKRTHHIKVPVLLTNSVIGDYEMTNTLDAGFCDPNEKVVSQYTHVCSEI